MQFETFPITNRERVLPRPPVKPTSHRINKNRRLRYGSISIPLNDAAGYRRAVKALQIWVFPPSQEMMKAATQKGLLNKVAYGLETHYLVEGITLDEETAIPWIVSKVAIHYKHIDYASRSQPYTQRSRRYEEQMVCPKTTSSTVTVAEKSMAIRKEDVKPPQQGLDQDVIAVPDAGKAAFENVDALYQGYKDVLFDPTASM